MTDMTDDELLEMDDEAFEEMTSNLDERVENTEPVEEVIDIVEEPIINEGSEEEETPKDVENNEETIDIEETEEVSETDEDTQDDTETEEEIIEEESQESDTEEEEFSYEASYKELMKPVKVSGKDVQVKSLEDARNLISMGIDYSRKMRDVKPLRAVGETLKQANIMNEDGTVDEAKLLRLVDIDNGDTNALAQLMAEKGIDPLDIETEKVEYSPQTSMVSESSLAIQDVEKELVSRGSVDNVISELDKLDDRSKQFFHETPANLLKLDDDIKSGTYEKIMSAVQYEKSLGRMTDVSDMDAYIQLASQEVPTQPIATKTKPSVQKRKAAGITKRAPVKKTVQPKYDFVNMSDEDFEAQHMKDVY